MNDHYQCQTIVDKMNSTADTVDTANESSAVSTADNKHRTRDTGKYTHECCLCEEQINDVCPAINCLYCNYRTHMLCIINKFKSVNSTTQFRNAAEWIKEF